MDRRWINIFPVGLLLVGGIALASSSRPGLPRYVQPIAFGPDGGDAAVDAGIAADGGDAAADGGDAAVDAGGDAGVNASSIVTDSSEYVTIAHNAAFDFTTQMSISMWIRKTGGTFSSAVDFMSRWGSSLNSWQVRTTAVGQLSLYIASSGTNSSNRYDCTGFAGNTAYHVVWTYNAGTVVQYVDGSVNGSCSVAGSIPTSLQTAARGISIGALFDGTSGAAGDYDEVALFNVALTSGEVASLRNGTHPADNISGVRGIVA